MLTCRGLIKLNQPQVKLNRPKLNTEIVQLRDKTVRYGNEYNTWRERSGIEPSDNGLIHKFLTKNMGETEKF